MSSRDRVVVAGGIASGKSQVVSLLSSLGWSVLKADELGHEALLQPAVIQAVARRWPATVVRGAITRKALARAVFAEPAELAVLEALTHPFIRDGIDHWSESAPKPSAVEISVLKVARSDWGLLVIVHAPVAIRRKRAIERGMTEADVDLRIASQPTDVDLLARAEIVVDNQGTIDDVIAATHRLDKWARSS